MSGNGPAGVAADRTVSDNPVVGAWELIDYQMLEVPPERQRPLGDDPLGRLIYTADGYMSVQYMPGSRPLLAAESWRSADDAEKLSAVNGYGGYSGRYRWLGDRVEHLVEASIYPNWIGATLVRRAAITGDELVLTADHARAGGPPTPMLRWRRR